MRDALGDVEAKIAALVAERQGIHKQMAPLCARLSALAEELCPLREERGRLKYGGALDWREVVRALASDDAASAFLSRRVEQELDRFDMLPDGYWADTCEASLQLSVRRTSESEAKCSAGVRFFGPLLTPHADGLVWFGLLEHTCSRHGSYTLKVKPDMREVRLCVVEWGHERLIKSFQSPEKAVKYIRKHHWYGD